MKVSRNSKASSPPANWVLRSRASLEKRHYVLKGNDRYWVGLARNRIESYKKTWHDDFYLIIAGQPDREDDYYAIPFSIIRPLLRASRDDDNRWVLSIDDHRLLVRGSPTVDVTPYYGVPLDGRGSALEQYQAPLTNAPVVEFVDVEAQRTEQFGVVARVGPREAHRREQKLVQKYKRWMEERGSRIYRQRISFPGTGPILYSDLFDNTRHNLLEAKGVVAREAIRMAIGQLADYRRFVPAETLAAVLLPHRPAPDLEALLSSQRIACVWPREDAGFDDNAGGRLS